MPKRANLVVWQWSDYDSFHHNKANLLLHLVAVPTFIGATFGLLGALATFHIVAAASALVTMAVAFAVQGFGHKRLEGRPSIPFDGPGDAATRIFTEQFISFPRFVLTGGWWNAFKNS